MKLKKIHVIFVVSLAVASLFFFLSFTQFNVGLRTQEIVDGDQVFVSSEKTAVDEFLQVLEEENKKNPAIINQGFGIGLFIDFRDSNGLIIPQDSNFVKVPFSDTSLRLNPTTDSLIGTNGEFLDFAKFQIDAYGVVISDDKVEVTAKYQVLSNDVIFLEGVIFGSGNTVDKQLNLKFEQGQKRGEAIELSFESGEIPMIVGHGVPVTNTIQFRIVEIEAVIGESFDTDRYYWKGTFPVYTLKYDASDTTRIIRDFRGIAIETLPNDIGIQVCGYDDGRLFPSQDFSAYAPIIVVKDNLGNIIFESDSPNWGNRDADFNSKKCGNIITGLERNTSYKFIVDGTSFDVITPSVPILYYAKCDFKSSGTSNPYTLFSCVSNFGWSK